jgi:hypothetical protein
VLGSSHADVAQRWRDWAQGQLQLNAQCPGLEISQREYKAVTTVIEAGSSWCWLGVSRSVWRGVVMLIGCGGTVVDHGRGCGGAAGSGVAGGSHVATRLTAEFGLVIQDRLATPKSVCGGQPGVCGPGLCQPRRFPLGVGHWVLCREFPTHSTGMTTTATRSRHRSRVTELSDLAQVEDCVRRYVAATVPPCITALSGCGSKQDLASFMRPRM